MNFYIEKFQPEEILEYLRKSRSDDPTLSVDEVLSRHREILKNWEERNLDGFVPEENIYREVVSGETLDGRPEILRILKRIEDPGSRLSWLSMCSVSLVVIWRTAAA